MNKKKLNKIVCTAVVSVFLATGFNSGQVKAATVTRKGGGDRYSTASAVAIDLFKKSDNVVLVNGMGYPDAVSATPLAKNLNAPVLLTQKDKLPDEVLSTIKKIGAKNVYIVGGEGVVSPSVYNALKSNGFNVTRYAKDGGSRYDTNAIVAKELISKTGAKKAILVNGQDGYSDALSVASIAAKLGIPVLITNSVKLDPEVKKIIDTYKLDVMAVGGTAILPDSIINSVKGSRIAQGKDRFKTNINVLNYFKSDLSFDNVYVASGGNDRFKNFADALVASATAAKSGAPLILSGNAASSQDILACENFIKNNINKNSSINLIGSTGVLSKDIENNLNKIAEETSEQDLEIIVIE